MQSGTTIKLYNFQGNNEILDHENKDHFTMFKNKQALKFSEDPRSGLLTHTHRERERERERDPI